MTAQEQKDLDEAKAKVQEIKVSAYEYMASALRYTERDFATSGHKNLQSMLEYILKAREKDIKRIWDAYVKKYPD